MSVQNPGPYPQFSLYLWIFGNNIEDATGHGRFIVFYLLCGVAFGAHIGGFLAGMALIPFYKHASVAFYAPAR
jgi:membrane associated rhomboid family serine protease